MNFEESLKIHISLLEQRPDFKSDLAFRRVVQLLKGVKSQEELAKQKKLINRIAVDSIENWDTINIISAFITSHTPK